MASDTDFLGQTGSSLATGENAITPVITTESFLPGLGPVSLSQSSVGTITPEVSQDLVLREVSFETTNVVELAELSIGSDSDPSLQADRLTGLASSAALAESGVDLVSIGFDATSDHVLNGRTAVTFLLQNQGLTDAGSFDVDILYSNDAVLGNEDDQIIRTVTISGLAAGAVLNQTFELELPTALLNTNALAEDPAGQGAGYVSLNKDFLGLVVDSGNAITELDESNNSNQGKGLDQDDITYFPWDVDDNGLVTPTDSIFVINRLGEDVNQENARADFDGNGVITPTDAIAAINRLGYKINPDVIESVTPPTITTVTEISPRRGERMVTLNREAIIRFSKAIDPTTINSDTVKVIALGEEVSGRLVVSSTEEFVTFFPDNPWNPSTEVRIQVDGNQILGRDGVAVDADSNGTSGGIVTADFRTLPITRIPGTDVFGYVYDSYNRNPDGSDIPLEGVEIRLDALPGVVAVTDENGYFILEDVPAPEFYVYIDGSKVEGVPDGSQYASLGKAFHSLPGQVIQLEMDGDAFDVYLPLMSGDDVVALSPDEDTEVGFGPDAQAFLEREFPDIDPSVWQRTQVTFVAGSAQDDQGNAATQATIVPVAPERLPAPLPPFVDPSLVISIQAGGNNGFNREADGGATNFDVPAPIDFPNLEGLLPGEKSLIWTFNHDAGDWEIIGTGTVSEDGLSIESDEGVGIRAPGWHFTNPGDPQGPDPNPPNPPLTPQQKKRIIDTFKSQGLQIAGTALGVGFGILAATGAAPIVLIGLGIGGAAVLASQAIGLNNSINSIINSGSRRSSQFRAQLSQGNSLQSFSIETGNSIGDQIVRLSQEALDSVQPFILSGEPLTQEVERKIVDLIEQANQLAGGDALQYMRNLQAENEESLNFIENPVDNAPPYPVSYAAQIQNSSGELFTVRGKTLADGQYSVIVPSGGNILTVTFYDALANSAGVVIPRASSNASFRLPRFTLIDADSEFSDLDGDDLVDIAEFVLGTSANKTDTDGDGINDFSEVQQGLDPLGERGFPTGIISSLPLTGEAKEVIVEGSSIDSRIQTAYIATGSQGLAITDVSQFNDPILLGQLDLPGDATDVAVDSTLQIAAIATNEGGLQLVDISDSMQPTLIQTVKANTNQVEIANGIAYISVDSNLRAIDLQSGQTIETLVLSGNSEITGITREGTTLYTMSADRNLRAIDISGFVMAELDSLVLEDGGGKVFVSNGIAYAPAVNTFRGGYATADVSNPSSISFISGAEVESPFIGPRTAIAENGSGVGIFVGSNAINTLQVLDTSNPENTNVLRTPIDLPSAPESVAIASGIGFVAGGESGLQVVNYLSFDSQGNAPTATISSVVSDADPSQSGTQVVEGSSIPISVALTDDVQVRNVELLVDGEVVANDVSAPYDFFATVPTLDSGATSVTIQVRATDTGGNSSLSNELVYDLVPDIVAPVIVGTTPGSNGASFRASTIGLRLSEAIDTSILDLSGVTLTNLGGDGIVGGGDDTAVALQSIFSPSDRRITFQTQAPLVFANYQVSVDSSIVADLAGNTLASPFSFKFTNYDLDPNTVVWVSDEDGDWNDSSNWSTGVVPEFDDDVVIDRIGFDPTITITGDRAQIQSLQSTETVNITTGSLSVTQASSVEGSFIIGNNGSLTANGAQASFIASSNTAIDGGSLFAIDGATITLPTVTSYTTSDERFDDSIFRATGTGSILDLSNLTTINGTTQPITYHLIEALEGGKVDLSKVIGITGPADGGGNGRGVQVLADGSSSEVDLSALTSFTNDAPAPDSKITARNNGTISASNLTTLDGVDIAIDGTGNLATSQINSLTRGAVSVDGVAADFSGLTDVSGNSFTLLNSGTANLDNVTIADGASFSVNDGVTLALPNLTSYTTSDQTFDNSIFRAAGVGSILDLSNLTSIEGTIRPITFHLIEALEGGKVNLNSVAEITGPEGGSGNTRGVQILADGNNSEVDLSILTKFTNDASEPDSKITARNNGTISASNLTTLDGVDIAIDGTGNLATSQINSLTRGAVSVDGVAADFSGLTDVSGNSFTLLNSGTANLDNVTIADGASFSVNDGVTLALPNLTSYTTSDQTFDNSIFRAAGVGSILDLSNLTSIEGTIRPITFHLIEALEGGKVNLNSVAEITGPEGGSGNTRGVQILADGNNSEVDLSILTKFTNDASEPDSKITARNNGTISASNLTTLDGVDIAIDGTGNLATSQINSLTRGAVSVDGVAADFSGLTDVSGNSFTLFNGGTANLDNVTIADGASFSVNDGVTLNLDNVTTADGASFFVNDGVTLVLPNLTSYTTSDQTFDNSIFRAAGVGSILDLSNLTSIEGTIRPITFHLIEALEGGKVNLNSVAEITGPEGGSGNDRGVQVLADGNNSEVDLSALTSFTNDATEPDSKLTARNSGTISADNLTTLDGVDIDIDGSGNLATSQINSLTRGAVSVDGVAADFSGLIDVSGNSFTLINGGTVNLDNVTVADGASFFVNDGVRLALPNLTSYTTSDQTFDNSIFRATGVGSILDLSNLTSIEGTIRPITFHLIEALEGGKVNLSSVTEITGPEGGSGNDRGVQVLADGNNSEVDFSMLTSFTNSASEPDSKLTARNNGTVSANNLTMLDGVNITSDSSTLNLPGLTDYNGDNIAEAINQGVLNLLNLANISNGMLLVRADGLGSVVNVDSITGLTEEELNGGRVNLT